MGKNIEELKPLSEWPIQINTGNKFIEMTLGKSWRMYAKYENQILEDLIKHYLGNEKSVPLLRANERNEGQSIESALIKCDGERLILIQTVLEFERQWIEDNLQKFEQIEKGQGGEINFSSLCKKVVIESQCDEHYPQYANGKILSCELRPKHDAWLILLQSSNSSILCLKGSWPK